MSRHTNRRTMKKTHTIIYVKIIVVVDLIYFNLYLIYVKL